MPGADGRWQGGFGQVQPLALAVPVQLVIDELRSVVRIYAEQWKRHSCSYILQCLARPTPVPCSVPPELLSSRCKYRSHQAFADIRPKLVRHRAQPDRSPRNASVTITGSDGDARTVMTTAFGYYRFDDVATGETYTISVASRRFRFTARRLDVTDNLTGVDFTAQE